MGAIVSERYANPVRRLREAVLTSAGVTESAVRQAVASRAATLSGAVRGPDPSVPPGLIGFVDKIARRAYTVTDDDVRALRQAGYSEDALFEITASAALGAGLGRLERGLAALKGEA